jgi:uncharacterized membrane protein YdjX (TVP38/TMEM64 family)
LPARLIRDRRVWLALGALVVLVAARVSGLTEFLSLEALRANRVWLVETVAAHGFIAVLAFVALYVAVVAFSVPGAVWLTLAGGFLFGPVLGTMTTVIAATIGATFVFLFARTLFGENLLDRFGEPARKLGDNIRRNAWSYLLVLRLVPLFPFFLVNVVPAFVGVRLPVYVGTTFVGVIPGTVVFTLAGAGLGSVLDQGGELSMSSILTPQVIAALTALGLLSLAAIPLRKRFAQPVASDAETVRN